MELRSVDDWVWHLWTVARVDEYLRSFYPDARWSERDAGVATLQSDDLLSIAEHVRIAFQQHGVQRMQLHRRLAADVTILWPIQVVVTGDNRLQMTAHVRVLCLADFLPGIVIDDQMTIPADRRPLAAKGAYV